MFNSLTLKLSLIITLLLGGVLFYYKINSKFENLEQQNLLLSNKVSELKANTKLLNDKFKNLKFEQEQKIKKIKTLNKIKDTNIKIKIQPVNTIGKNKNISTTGTSATNIKNLKPGNYSLEIK